MAKRKKSTTKNSSKILTYIAWFLAFVAMGLSALVSGYYFGYEDAKKELAKQTQIEQEKRLNVLQKLEELSTKEVKKDEISRLKEVLKKEKDNYASASHEYDDAPIVLPPKPIKREIKSILAKPKLAIIIDDISVQSHVNAIKSLNMPITMSFLPPSPQRPNSAKLAAKEDVYMVHLPMEAQSFSAEEPNTLRIDDSQKKISLTVSNIKQMFPKVEYINNHTGSKFTSNEIAMNRLVFALKSQNIHFVDSRTTADTKAPKVMKNYGLNYMARDIFLDHEMEKTYVKKQIKKAIKLAKAHGSAIAIGHPHVNTIMALNESKNLFNEVELVYINKLH
jgi:uncharacterized protein